MHELSVAHAIVTTVADAVPADVRVREVHVRIGALSGVIDQALHFSYDVAVDGTPLADAVLVIERVPVSVHCTACDDVVELPTTTNFACPRCGTPSGDVRTGRELQVARVVFDETGGGDVAPTVGSTDPVASVECAR